MHQRSCYQLIDPTDVRGHTSSVWVHSANQIILFHFALAIYDEFDDNNGGDLCCIAEHVLLQIRFDNCVS